MPPENQTELATILQPPLVVIQDKAPIQQQHNNVGNILLTAFSDE